MPDYLIYTAVIAAFVIGGGFGVLIMCIFAINKMGEDDIPHIPPRHFQD